jgi:DNA-binding CsgD family transcriptional regulator/tetratricopeptide (TPR) repeat protein
MHRAIVERDYELAQLADAARDAANGTGSVVLVHGEAGIGKSSVVQAVRALLPAEGRFVIGYCDDLATPRTLGPFRDLARSVGPELIRALRGGEREDVLGALQRELDSPGHPTVLVIEDVHWADEATLDVLRILLRRIDDLPAILVLTYRDDSLTRDHPLQPLLGDASTTRIRRLALRRLSMDAVQRLSAGTSLEARQVFEVTSGNPFFVSEIIAAGEPGVPATVVDAVLARVRGLEPATQNCLNQLAVVPSAVDRWLVDTLVADAVGALDEAEARGLLVVTPTQVAFRHELARRAVVDSMSVARRVHLHRRVLAALVARDDADLSRVVNHAREAGDIDAVARFGPQAARDAAGAGAYREAAAHYLLVLEHADRSPPGERAELLEGYAAACHTIGDSAIAADAQRDAVALRRSLGDSHALGMALRWLSRMSWWSGDRATAESTAEEAIAVCEQTDDARLRALALTNQAEIHMLGDRNRDVVAVAERVIALAEASGDPTIQSEALNTVGTSRWLLGDADGQATVKESLRIALAAEQPQAACRAYANLSAELLDHCRFDEAARYLDAGLDLATHANLLGYVGRLQGTLGRLELARGRWDEAIEAAGRAVGEARPIRCVALLVLGRVRVRRGEPGGEDLLDQAWDLAMELREMQHLGIIAAARAEAAWLRGASGEVLACIQPVYDRLCPPELVTPVQAEVAYWRTQAGQPTAAVMPNTAYGLQAAGRWQESAAVWQTAGCPYEYAAALAESPDPADLLTALAPLDALGARPLAALVRARLRRLGVAHVPRGPVQATLGNPAGLTDRQLEVLRLLSTGLSNAEIAKRLFVSTRTVDSHVAAVLDKLGVGSRRDAAARAVELGVVES